MNFGAEAYLRPYLDALRRHGDAVESLLWASRQTQRARFAALARACDFADRRVLDAGCGRADLLDYLLGRGIAPAEWIGLEAVEEFAEDARRKQHPRTTIIDADFVKEPARMLVGAEVIIFCGSLNTLHPETFHQTLRTAFEAASQQVVFNFLSSPALAAAPWLTWHRPEDVEDFGRTLTDDLVVLSDYMDGDCTVALRRKGAEG